MKRHFTASKRDGWPKCEKAGNVTVKIYRRRRADGQFGYEVADYSTGSRKLKSFADEATARDEARRIARLLAAGEVAAARVTNGDAATLGTCTEILRPTGVPLVVAVNHFAEAWKLLGADRIVAAAEFYRRHAAENLRPATVAQVVAELLASKSNRRLNTIEDLRARCTTFAESFPNVQIASIATADIQRWLDGLAVTERTRLNYRSKVRQLFAFAERRGYIARGANPVDATERPQPEPPKIEIYTPDEIRLLLGAAVSPEFQACLAIGAFAGLRSSEILHLDWANVELGRRFIEAAGTKRGTPSRRIVPITDNLAAWLSPVARREGLIWEPDVANRARAEEHFCDAQTKTAAAPGLRWKPNALRHSFISYRLAGVGDAARVALEAGNSAATIFKHYRELVTPAAAAEYFGIVPPAAGQSNIVNLKAVL